MPTYDGTYKLAVEDGRVLIRDVEGGSQSTHVPLEIYSNYAAQGTLTDSRQLRLRTQPYLESNTANAYVTDMGIESGQTDNYFFITAPQKTANAGDRSTFVISKTSNVGIGTTDPEKPLHVVGDSWVTGTLTASNIIGASPVTISSNLVMASGFTLTAGAIEPPTGAESNLKITGTITTSNITHDSELTVTSNLLMGSDKTLTTSNIVGSSFLTVTANTNVVAEFTESSRYYNVKEPRSAMTANSSFGYTASASSIITAAYDAYKAFDTGTTSNWVSATGKYNSSTGAYEGSTTFEGVSGEWIKLQMPSSISLGYINLYKPPDATSPNPPKSGRIFASQDGSTWTQIYSFINLSYSSNDLAVLNINSTNYYSYYNIVIESVITGWSSPQSYTAISEIEYYGTPYTAATNDGTDVLFKTVPNTPKTDFLDVYYDASNTNSSSTVVKNIVDDSSATPVDLTFTSTDPKTWYFNGSTSNVTGTHGLGTGNVPHSHAIWFKRTSANISPSVDYIALIGTAGTNSGTSLIYIYNNQIRWDIWNDFRITTTSTTIENDKWYHVVVSYYGDNDTIKIYINGQIQGSTTGGSGTLNLTGTTLVLGYRPDTSSDYFNGSIANYRLYDRALSADEVWELYGNQKAYFSVSPDVVTYKAGRVGIGTSEPRAVLDVVGDASISGGVGIGTTSSSYKLHVAGDIYATGNITGYSDERAKSDIQKIENALEKIEKLNGYTFTMNNKRYTGMIAQEVLQVLPEAVVGTEETEYALAYGNMMGLIIEAIKEIKKKLDM